MNSQNVGGVSSMGRRSLTFRKRKRCSVIDVIIIGGDATKMTFDGKLNK